MSDKPVQPSEAGFSTNLYLNHTASGRVQFTFRGAHAGDWQEVMVTVHDFLAYMHQQGWLMDGEAQEAKKSAVTPFDPEPVRTNLDGDGNEVKTFTADRLSVETKDGKTYYKVIGTPFTKYGVNVWPEVLEAAGIDGTANIAGWRADYVTKVTDKGQTVPAKVVRLLPPK